jgi:hypothetical protein
MHLDSRLTIRITAPPFVSQILVGIFRLSPGLAYSYFVLILAVVALCVSAICTCLKKMQIDPILVRMLVGINLFIIAMCFPVY